MNLNYQKLILIIAGWSVGIVLVSFMMLRFGKGWDGIAHTLIPASIVSAAFAGMIVFIIWTFATVFGRADANAARGAEFLNKYFEEYLETGELKHPRVIIGGTVRYSGEIRDIPIQLDFFCTAMQFPAHEGDLRTIEQPFALSLAVIRVKLPEHNQSPHDALSRRAEQSLSQFNVNVDVTLGWMFLNTRIQIIDSSGQIQINRDQLRQMITVMVNTARNI